MVISLDLLHAPPARSPRQAFGEDLRRGLTKSPKSISSAYFYDDRGSQLFQQITQQPEYYLTRCEHAILVRHGEDLVRALGNEPCRVLEIGAGDGQKTEVVLKRLLAAGVVDEYVPVDICRRAVVELTSRLRERLAYSSLRLRGVVAEYYDALDLLGRQGDQRTLVLFLGSSIGNFGPRGALRLLRGLRQSLTPGDLLLIGFDLKKDLAIVRPAYDDAAGITRAFNLNLLQRINREMGGEFDIDQFLHHAEYNLRLGCMESWLVSRRRQRVPIARLRTSVELEAWEGIRVERSYKYDLDQIESLATMSGFEVRAHFFDDRRYFVDSLWTVKGR
jgi:dimethylhistidine N-methyltransferase